MEFLNKNTIGLSFLIFFLALTSCEQTVEKKSVADTRPSVKVQLTKAGNASIEDMTALSGKIQAEKFVTVSTRIMGYLTNVRAEVGDKVQKGQVLAAINSNEIKAKMAQADAGITEAKAGLKNIEKDFARIQALYKKKSATQKELDDITTHREMTLAKIKQAEEMKNEAMTMYSYATIRAPFSGVITEKHIHSGDLANPGRPLFTVEATNAYQAAVLVPESIFPTLKKGDEVKVFIKSNNQELTGKISELSRSSVRTGGQYLTKIDLDKKALKDTPLYSGMYLKVLFPQKNQSTKNKKVLVNQNALVKQGQLTGIYTKSENNTAILRWIRLGKTYGDQVEVLSGLALGEQYIASAEGRLMNGVKVIAN
jgi:RND family efflux transporter MFP subunit